MRLDAETLRVEVEHLQLSPGRSRVVKLRAACPGMCLGSVGATVRNPGTCQYFKMVRVRRA
jgi:hypothetical protein